MSRGKDRRWSGFDSWDFIDRWERRKALHPLGDLGGDLSPALLQVARDRAAERGVAVNFVRGDMRSLPFEPEFDAVINVFTSFGYFEEEEGNRQVIREAARVLRPGGRLLLELINRGGWLPRFQPKLWHEILEGFVLNATTFDPMRSRTLAKDIFISRSGHLKEYSFSTRAYSVHELRSLLLENGFEHVEAYGGLDRSAFAVGGMRTVLLADKPEAR